MWIQSLDEMQTVNETIVTNIRDKQLFFNIFTTIRFREMYESVERNSGKSQSYEILLKLQHFFHNTNAHNKYKVYLLKFHSIHFFAAWQYRSTGIPNRPEEMHQTMGNGEIWFVYINLAHFRFRHSLHYIEFENKNIEMQVLSYKFGFLFANEWKDFTIE